MGLDFQEVSESLGTFIRWTEQPKGPEDESIFIGTTVQGTYVDKTEDVGQNNSNVYKIKTKENGVISVWGSKVLDGKMDKVPKNHIVRITYLGMQDPQNPQGRAYKNFKVEQAKPPMQEVDGSGNNNQGTTNTGGGNTGKPNGQAQNTQNNNIAGQGF